MRAPLILAAGLIFACLAPAGAEPVAQLFPGAAIAADELAAKRGGTETNISGSLLQSNDSTLNAANTGDVSISGGAQKYSGTIAPASVTGNHGITAVMQNTGDLVNMNNATSVNVYMR
ncbi:MAG: hypothetical protein K2X44_10975 [Magnetospirillum sp.]|nr:hypothetical protein [Magnetospirillum sp.]